MWRGLALAAAVFLAQIVAAESTRPHIVYILADDLGYGDLSCLNPNSKLRTENIDRIAREGVRFTDAHSGSSVCTPTRYGILTGRYSWRTPLKSGVTFGYAPSILSKERLTVADMLKDAGYYTAGIGKWHLGLGYSTTDGRPASHDNIDYAASMTDSPVIHGFDYYFGIPASLDMDPYIYIENDRIVEPATDQINKSEGVEMFRAGPRAPGFHHNEVLEKFTTTAERVIAERGAAKDGKPLFLYLPLAAPHTPVLPTGDFVGKSGVSQYGDFVLQVDAAVGRVMAALELAGMLEDTLLVFTSDNGFAPAGDLEAQRAKGHEPSYVFRGHKADLFEGGHRVPFLVRWPGVVAPSRECSHLICHTDLMATLADLLSTPLPTNAAEDSVSWLGALRSEVAAPARSAAVHHSAKGYFAIRQGRWKLLFTKSSGGWSKPNPEELKKAGGDTGVQLYDMAVDPGETNDVSEQHLEVVAKLTLLMEDYIAQGRSTPGPAQENEGETPLWLE